MKEGGNREGREGRRGEGREGRGGGKGRRGRWEQLKLHVDFWHEHSCLLLQLLAEVVHTADKHITVMATILMGQLLHLVRRPPPTACCVVDSSLGDVGC